MAIQNIHYYEVGDDWGNDYRIIGCFSNENIAKQYSEGRGSYGQKASVKHKVVLIVDTIPELEQADMVAKKNAALAKLTTEEKKLLGLL